jgi:C-terminal processing protease CtpA/Prc
MVVTVPGAGIVRFAAQVFSAKYVTIDDETGYLGSVGLKTGDLVIGLDGVEFKDATHMGARFMEARANPSTKLMVLRGAKRFTVVVDLKKTSGREAGGSWRDSVR